MTCSARGRESSGTSADGDWAPSLVGFGFGTWRDGIKGGNEAKTDAHAGEGAHGCETWSGDLFSESEDDEGDEEAESEDEG